MTKADELKREIEAERDQLAGAVENLRSVAKAKARLPLLALATGFAVRRLARRRGK